MILEVAILHVINVKAEEFENDFALGGQYIGAIKGYAGHSLQKCMEHENKYILLVNWQAIEDHAIGFRQSEHYQKWKALLHHYYDPFPVVEHYSTIIENLN